MKEPLIHSARLKAILASFAVYLLPVVGPHSAVLLGPTLVMEIAEGRNNREPLWIVADFALALCLQLVFGYLAYRVFQKSGWHRRLALIAAALPLFLILELCYLIAFPSTFLIDPDRAREIATWEVECTIPESYLAAVPIPPDVSLERAGQAWVARNADSRLSLLRMPGCVQTELDLVWSNASPRIASVALDGRVIYKTYDRDSGQWQWWYLEKHPATPQPIEQPPHTRNEMPILSSEAEWVAWLQRIPEGNNRTRPQVLLESLETGDTKTIDLSAFAPASFRLVGLDRAETTFTLARNGYEFLGLGWDGNVRWGPWRPEGVEAWAHSIRRFEKGWVAWDGYRENDAYRISWSLPAGSGNRTVLKGRSIKSLAVDPEGTYIAVSTDARYSFGNVKNTIYVFRSSIGEGVFRKHLPQHSRSQVTFLGPHFFAYTDLREVRVLRIPEHSSTPVSAGVLGPVAD